MACLAAVLRLACSWSSCLASCPVLITACLPRRVLVGVSSLVLGPGLSGSSSVVVLLLSGVVSRLRPLLGCLGSGRVLSSPPPPSSQTLSPLFAVTLETRVALLSRCWLAAGSLLARCWLAAVSLLSRCCLACGAVRLCTEEPCQAVLGRRGLHAFYEVTPPWVCLG